MTNCLYTDVNDIFLHFVFLNRWHLCICMV